MECGIELIPKEIRSHSAIKKNLTSQTYKDFEFVGSAKGTIPEAWNDAISRAKGDYFVFTETDARPLNNRWLEEINQKINNLKKKRTCDLNF